jgi:hypothetical protein
MGDVKNANKISGAESCREDMTWDSKVQVGQCNKTDLEGIWIGFIWLRIR